MPALTICPSEELVLSAFASRLAERGSVRLRAALEREVNLVTTHGRRLFPRGGEDCPKNCNTPQNGSRGGDTFCPPRGGVEGGKGGGANQIFVGEKTRMFAKTLERKARFLSKTRAISSLRKLQKVEKICSKMSIFPLSWLEFFLKVPDFWL